MPAGSTVCFGLADTRGRVCGAVCAARDKSMPALTDVEKELLRGFQFCALPPHCSQLLIDHVKSPQLIAMQNQTDLRQAQSDRPARLHDAKSLRILLAIVPVP